MADQNDRKNSTEKTDPVQVQLDSHIESTTVHRDVTVDAATKGQAATGYETVSLWDTVKTFKIATACCFAAAFSAGADGYQMA